MIEKWLRKPYQIFCVDKVALSLPLLHPLWATFLAAFFGILAALFILIPWLSISLILLSGYFDTLDGTLARIHKKQSPIGAALDIVSDRLVEALMIIALFVVDQNRAPYALGMLAAVLICITSFLVVAIFTENSSKKSFHYSPGIIERPEAFCFFILMILFPAFFTPLACTFIAMVSLTAAIRLYHFAFIFLDQ